MEAVTSRSYSRPTWISCDSLAISGCFVRVAGIVPQAAQAARRPAVTLRPGGRRRGRGREASMGALLSINDAWVRYTDEARCKPKPQETPRPVQRRAELTRSGAIWYYWARPKEVC